MIVRKKFLIITLILLILNLIIVSAIFADEEVTKVILDDEKVTINDDEISESENQAVYLTSKMNNGGNNSEALKANIEIDKIININKSGTYEFTGSLSNGQISINANDISGEINIILNNVNISCDDAPAIFIYSKDIEKDDLKITISLAEKSENFINGGKIKQNVETWEDQNSILYYIEKGRDDDGTYYERYKYDAAISSDISLNFDGEGILNVTSDKKEGIESKMNLTFDGGTYNIKTVDDGINACEEGKSQIVINAGTIIVNVSADAEEGDGIDSNGSITINGGTVYTFACPGSDNGLDSDSGVYINGGNVVSTGDMSEELKSSNSRKIVQINFSKEVSKDDTILIVDENENAIFAYKTDRKITTFAYSSDNLENKEYTVYIGNAIEGSLENKIYTEITSFDLSKMEKQDNSEMNMRGPMGEHRNFNQQSQNNNTEIMYKTLIISGILFILALVLFSVLKSKKEFLIFVLGLLIGIMLISGGFIIYNNIIMEDIKIPENEQMDMPKFNEKM